MLRCTPACRHWRMTRGFASKRLMARPASIRRATAGEPKSDQRNNEKLVAALRGQTNRKAHYYCVIVLVHHADDPEPLIAEGRWHGEIIDSPRGAGGFGYDPFFFVPEFGRTGAELTTNEKNSVSHRGKALRALADRLKAG